MGPPKVLSDEFSAERALIAPESDPMELPAKHHRTPRAEAHLYFLHIPHSSALIVGAQLTLCHQTSHEILSY